MRLYMKTIAFLLLGTLLLFSCKKDAPQPQPPVANAGNDQTVQLPAASFTLSGSGTTPQGSITNYTWSLVSGPNNPVINNASSATTSVSGFIAGTYVFQLQVTNDDGLTATDDVSVTVVAEETAIPVANAGADQTLQLPAGFFVLSGSGTTEKGTITDYNWTQISGPNSSIIDNPSSSTTSVSGFINGTYKFQLQVTNSFGLSAKDTVIINVVGGTQTLTIQPANNSNEFLYLNWNGVDNSGVGHEDIPIEAWTNGGTPYTVRAAIKFDLSSIPANATIVSANLYLYSYPSPTLNGNFTDANFGTDNSMLVQQITSDWSPGTTNWSNQPSTSTTNQIVVPSTNQSSLDLNLDVTSMVSSMVNNSANYGFFLKIQNEVTYNSRIFVSSYTTSYTDKHPKLVVVYQ